MRNNSPVVGLSTVVARAEGPKRSRRDGVVAALLATTCLFGFFACTVSRASVYITITGANVRRAKIAVGQVHPMGDPLLHDATTAKKLHDQLLADLEFTNLFDFVNPASFVASDQSGDLNTVKYDDIAALGASFMLKLAYRSEGTKLILEGVLYDIAGKKKIFETRYQYPAAQYPRLVHALSEHVMRELTGEKGLFFSRIAMVCWDKKKRSPAKEIYVIDPDGRNLTQLTFDNTLSLSPSWSPNGKFLTYTQYAWRAVRGVRKKGTVLKKHDLSTGSRSIVSAKEGMNSGAAWMPNGKRIAATLSFTGRPEIYLLDPDAVGGDPDPFSRNIQWKKMTGEGFQSSSASLLFDVEPNFSPDGTKMVISSARSGHPMIYTVELGTRVANQLTFAGQYNASPAWSPKGDKILFAAQRLAEGNFDLYVIDPDGNNLARVTNGERSGRRVNSENPSWAPTGRHFAFASNEGGSYGVFISTLDGQIRRRISPATKECKTASWGPPEG